MDPLKEFEWCFGILRTYFKFVQQDIADEHSSRFYIVAIFIIFTEISFTTTIFDKYYDLNTRYICLGGLFTITQVSLVPSYQISLSIKLYQLLNPRHMHYNTFKNNEKQ